MVCSPSAMTPTSKQSWDRASGTAETCAPPSTMAACGRTWRTLSAVLRASGKAGVVLVMPTTSGPYSFRWDINWESEMPTLQSKIRTS
jgi:hypothetical protein